MRGNHDPLPSAPRPNRDDAGKATKSPHQPRKPEICHSQCAPEGMWLYLVSPVFVSTPSCASRFSLSIHTSQDGCCLKTGAAFRTAYHDRTDKRKTSPDAHPHYQNKNKAQNKNTFEFACCHTVHTICTIYNSVYYIN